MAIDSGKTIVYIAVFDIYKNGGIKALKEIPAVGEGIARAIEEYLKTGKIKQLGELKKKLPLKIDELSKVEGLGPKKIKVLYVISLALLIFSIAIVMLMGVSGTGNTKIIFRFEIVAMTIYQITAFLLAIVFKLQVQYVWFVECLYFFMTGVMCYFYLRSGKWKSIKI